MADEHETESKAWAIEAAAAEAASRAAEEASSSCGADGARG